MDNAKRRTLKVMAANLVLNAGAFAPMHSAGAARRHAGPDGAPASAKAPAAGGASTAPFMIGGTPYSNLGAALVALRDGQTLDIAPGRYPGQCGHASANRVTIQCKGEAVFDTVAQNKSTFVISGSDATVRGLAGENLRNTDGNGGLLRMEGRNWSAENIRIDRCETGILSSYIPGSVVHLKNIRGTGNGTPGDGQSHAVYIGDCDECIAEELNLADTNVGHLFKCRALVTRVRNSKLIEGRASCAIDLPRRGSLWLESSYLEQSQETDNRAIIQYAGEAARYKDTGRAEIHIAADVVIVDRRSPTGVALNLKLQPDVLDVHFQYNPANAPNADANPRHVYEGVLDEVDERGVRGWLYDSTSPNVAVPVTLTIDGQVQTVLANVPRADLAPAGKGNGVHAFAVNLLLAAGTHTVSARDPNGRDLQNSPVSLRLFTSDWRAGLPLRQLVSIAGTEPAKTYPLPASHLVGSYSGIAINWRDGVAIGAAAAGHAVSNSNAVTACDFRKGFKWELLRASSKPDDASTLPGSHFPDGRPKGSHRYYDSWWLPLRGDKGIVVNAVGAAVGFDGAGPCSTDCFDLTKNDWDLGGWPEPVPHTGRPFEAGCCVDPRDHRIWTTNANGFICDRDPGTRALRSRKLQNSAGGYAWYGSLIDPNLNAFMHDQAAYETAGVGTYIAACNLNSLAITRHALKWTGPVVGGWHALTRSTATGIYYWMKNEGTYGYIDPRDWSAAQLGTTTPAEGHVYNKWQYVPYLKGIVYLSGYNRPWQFMATEA